MRSALFRTASSTAIRRSRSSSACPRTTGWPPAPSASSTAATRGQRVRGDHVDQLDVGVGLHPELAHPGPERPVAQHGRRHDAPAGCLGHRRTPRPRGRPACRPGSPTAAAPPRPACRRRTDVPSHSSVQKAWRWTPRRGGPPRRARHAQQVQGLRDVGAVPLAHAVQTCPRRSAPVAVGAGADVPSGSNGPPQNGQGGRPAATTACARVTKARAATRSAGPAAAAAPRRPRPVSVVSSSSSSVDRLRLDHDALLVAVPRQ